MGQVQRIFSAREGQSENQAGRKIEVNRFTQRRIDTAFSGLCRGIEAARVEYPSIPFFQFFQQAAEEPRKLRNIFNLFLDMLETNILEICDSDCCVPGFDVWYDYSQLFVEGVDKPFYIGQMAAYRLLEKMRLLAKTMRNKICLFEGPHGTGKSLMLDIMMQKLEEYTYTDAGQFWRVVWRLDKEKFHWLKQDPVAGAAMHMFMEGNSGLRQVRGSILTETDEYVQIQCPCNDHPVSLLPLGQGGKIRRNFFDDILPNTSARYSVFGAPEYEWVFQVQPCALCSSLADVLSGIVGLKEVLDCVHAERFLFNRRLGEGINIFGPGDKISTGMIDDLVLKKRLSGLPGAERIITSFSRGAKFHNEVCILMDIQRENVRRLEGMHNEISDRIRKTPDGHEEDVGAFFIATINEEDREKIKLGSMWDRVEEFNVNYSVDCRAAISILKDVFGKRVLQNWFLPGVLENFVRAIVATRLKLESSVIFNLIDFDHYRSFGKPLFLLSLLKLEIYFGRFPPWLSDEDKQLLVRSKKKIIEESAIEGRVGFSGRDPQKILARLLQVAEEKDRPIGMGDLVRFFGKLKTYVTGLNGEAEQKRIMKFVAPLEDIYDYDVLKQVRTSLASINEAQIRRSILNYLFALNFNPGDEVKCPFTDDVIQVSEHFLDEIEEKFLSEKELWFKEERREVYQKDYSHAAGAPIEETSVFERIYQMWIKQIHLTVLDEYEENPQFRQAVKDYGKADFASCDKKMRLAVERLIRGMINKYGYEAESAQQIILYVLDKKLNYRFQEE